MLKTSERYVAEPIEADADQCSHHWLIDAADGPTSRGVCRLCGAEQQFKNYLENTGWEREAIPLEPLHPVGLSLGSKEAFEEEQ